MLIWDPSTKDRCNVWTGASRGATENVETTGENAEAKSENARDDLNAELAESAEF